jgi:hypothetical protein
MNSSEIYHTRKQLEDMERLKDHKQFLNFLNLMKTTVIKKCSAGAYYKQI